MSKDKMEVEHPSAQSRGYHGGHCREITGSSGCCTWLRPEGDPLTKPQTRSTRSHPHCLWPQAKESGHVSHPLRDLHSPHPIPGPVHRASITTNHQSPLTASHTECFRPWVYFRRNRHVGVYRYSPDSSKSRGRRLWKTKTIQYICCTS